MGVQQCIVLPLEWAALTFSSRSGNAPHLMSAVPIDTSPLRRAPLFLIAGCHGSLHWALATFYVLLPFIQHHLGITYAETGLLASMVHVVSLAANVPSGALVDVTGRRVACQLTALLAGAVGIGALGIVTSFWAVIAFVGILAAMNTLWHPAAISFLSSTYPERRGMALSFHTVGASLGDALAPITIGACIAAMGWQSSAIVGAVPPLIAAVLLWIYFGRTAGDALVSGNASRRDTADYLAELRSVIKDSRIWAVCLLAGLRGTCQVGLRAFLPLYVVNELGAGAIWVGIVIFAFQAPGVITTPIVGGISDRFGRRRVLLTGLILSGILVSVMPNVSQMWLYTGVVALTGASLMSLRPVVQGWALDLTPPSLGGSTITIVFGVQAAFAMTVPVLSGLVADRWGLPMAFYLFSAAAGAAAVVALIVAGNKDA
jgi:MFS family permease